MGAFRRAARAADQGGAGGEGTRGPRRRVPQARRCLGRRAREAADLSARYRRDAPRGLHRLRRRGECAARGGCALRRGDGKCGARSRRSRRVAARLCLVDRGLRRATRHAADGAGVGDGAAGDAADRGRLAVHFRTRRRTKVDRHGAQALRAAAQGMSLVGRGPALCRGVGFHRAEKARKDGRR